MAGYLLDLFERIRWFITERWWLRWSIYPVAAIASAIMLIVALVFVVELFAYCSTWGLRNDEGRPIDWNRLARGDYKKATTVYDRNGYLIGMHFTEIRDPVKYEVIPKPYVDAIIAAEDKRFWNHWGIDGIDVIAVTRAVFSDALHLAGLGSRREVGASTIAMQFAKTFYADEVEVFRSRGNNETNLQKAYRKWLELRFAVQLSKRYNRKKLMEGFLNTIYYGDGTNGIAAAHYHYFGIPINSSGRTSYSVATVRRAVMLAALNKSASDFNPVYREPVRPERAAGEKEAAFQQRWQKYLSDCARRQKRMMNAQLRWNWNLQRMYEEGSIGGHMYSAALFPVDEPWARPEIHVTPLKVREHWLASRFAKELLLTNGFDDDAITRTGGYKVYTSLDRNIQELVAGKLRKWLAKLNSELPAGAPKLNGSAVVLDLYSSQILAIVGGDDFFNRAMSVRSAGSASKLAVYTAYLEKTGKSYGDKLCNCPFSMPAKVNAKGQVTEVWSPGNFQEKNAVPFGPQRIDLVFTRSVNLPALWAVREIGVPSFVDMAHRLGMWGTPGVVRDPDGNVVLKVLGASKELKDGIDPYLPTAIRMNVNLIELANAFATVARRGTYRPPSFIREVRDAEERVVYTAPSAQALQVADQEVCRKMTVLLRGVTKVGTLRISMRGSRQEAAAKTGTSNEANDLQVAGFTPDLVLVIRLGYDTPKPVELPVYMRNASHDPSLNISAGWVVGPLWRDIIDSLYANRPPVPFPEDTEDDLAAIVERYKYD
jgi:membrane peptidoglycan carboxypeptidase